MTRRANPEEQFQKSVAQLLDSLGWLWWHTPLGELRPKKTTVRKGRRVTYSPTGKKLKDMGAKNGIADVIIAEPWYCLPADLPTCANAPYPVDRTGTGTIIAVELKIGRNTTTKAQRAWIKAVRDRGWLTAICRTMDEVMAVCRMVRPLNGRRLT